MRLVIALAVSLIVLVGCDTNTSSRLVEYVADGRAASIDVAFIAPAGLPAPSDTTFVPGDSTYTSGDTTFVLNVSPTWRWSFKADDGQRLFLRSEEHTSELQSRPHLVCRLLLEKKKSRP